MTPYYEHGGITIYHGDCRDVLPGLPFACVVADPPYGINAPATRPKAWATPSAAWRNPHTNDFPAVVGDDEPFDPAHLITGKPAILWGANYYHEHLPSGGGWLIWDKHASDGWIPLDHETFVKSSLLAARYRRVPPRS